MPRLREPYSLSLARFGSRSAITFAFASALYAGRDAAAQPAPPAVQIAALDDARLPVATVRTMPVQETTYRQEWSTAMVETPVRRWIAVPRQVTTMQAPPAPHPIAGTAPWLVNVQAVEWRLVEDKVRTPVTTSRIVPETRTVQKQVRELALEPGARALASNLPPVSPIPGANRTATLPPGAPRVATGPNTTIPSTTVPSNASPPSTLPAPVGGNGPFPLAPFATDLPLPQPLRGPAPTPWTAGAQGPTPLWGGIQNLDIAPPVLGGQTPVNPRY